jgi:hypothetical protein
MRVLKKGKGERRGGKREFFLGEDILGTPFWVLKFREKGRVSVSWVTE